MNFLLLLVRINFQLLKTMFYIVVIHAQWIFDCLVFCADVRMRVFVASFSGQQILPISNISIVEHAKATVIHVTCRISYGCDSELELSIRLLIELTIGVQYNTMITLIINSYSENNAVKSLVLHKSFLAAKSLLNY